MLHKRNQLIIVYILILTTLLFTWQLNAVFANSLPNHSPNSSFLGGEVGLTLSSNLSNPTNETPFVITASAGEPITGFVSSDITVINGTLDNLENSGLVTDIFTLTVSPTADGLVTVNIPAGAAEGDGSGEPTQAAIWTVVFDSTDPAVTVNQSSSTADPTNGSAFFTITFDEPINPSTLTVGDVNTAGSTAAGVTVVSVNQIAPNDDTTFQATINASGSGVILASIPAGVVEDEAGNTNEASTSSDNSVTIDLTPPTVTLNQRTGTPDPTNGPAEFTIQFSEPINEATFTQTDFSIAGSTAPNITFVSLTEEAPGNDTVFTAVYTVTGNGLLQLAVMAGAVEDVVGNSNSSGSTSSDNQVTFDFTNPGVTLSTPITQVTNLADLPVQALFTAAVQGFASGDIEVENGTVEDFSQVSGSTYTFTITPQADGVITVTIPAGVATSTGNPNLASNVLTLVSDRTPPVITLRPLEPPFIYLNEPYTEPGADVIDAWQGVITDQLQISGTVVITTVGQYTLTYMAMDQAGNWAEPVQRVVEVRPRTYRLYLPLVNTIPFTVTGSLTVSPLLQGGLTSYQPNLTFNGLSFTLPPAEMKIWVGEVEPEEWITYTNNLAYTLNDSHIGQLITVSVRFKLDETESAVFSTQVFYLRDGDFSAGTQPNWITITNNSLVHTFTNGKLQLGNPTYGCRNASLGNVRAEFTLTVPSGYVLRVAGTVMTGDQLPSSSRNKYDAFEIYLNEAFQQHIGNFTQPLSCTLRPVPFDTTVNLVGGSNEIWLENHLRFDSSYNTYTDIEAVWVEKAP